MPTTSRFRRLAVPAAVLMAVTLGAQPVAAEQVLHETGLVGPYEIFDNAAPTRGANCLYETGSYDLDKITVRGPQHVHGVAGWQQWIGYSFVIQKQKAPFSGPFTDYYTSSIVKHHADDSIPTNFARRSWTAPEAQNGHWRVKVVIRWYKRHTSTVVSGKAVILYQWYTGKWNGNQRVDMDYCGPDY